MWIKARGMGRFSGYERNDLTIMRKNGKWYASVTLRVSDEECRRDRTGHGIRGFDQGLTERLVFDDGESVPNERWLSKSLNEMAELQQARAKCKKGSRRFEAIGKKLRDMHASIANRRRDGIHKLSAKMVQSCELLASEEMNVASMVDRPEKMEEKDPSGKPTGAFLPNGAGRKAKLNRENLSAGYSMLLGMLGYKAEKVGCRFILCDTKKVKPTQRCAMCGRVEKKALGQRLHECPCGFVASRDRNSALVCLVDALWPDCYGGCRRAWFRSWMAMRA